MDTTEMTAWLGPAAKEMNPDQQERFARAWDEVGKRYSDRNDAGRRDAALIAAVQYLLGEMTIDRAGAEREATRDAAALASAAAQQMAVMAVEDGMSEVEAARRARIDRRWLRRLQGKD